MQVVEKEKSDCSHISCWQSQHTQLSRRCTAGQHMFHCQAAAAAACGEMTKTCDSNACYHRQRWLGIACQYAPCPCLLSGMQELRQHHLTPVFNQLQQWAAGSAPALAQHPSGFIDTKPNHSHAAHSSSAAAAAVAVVGAGATSAAAAQRQLPLVALSVASSTNTSDTYAQLKVALKKKVRAAGSLAGCRQKDDPSLAGQGRSIAAGMQCQQLPAMLTLAMQSAVHEPYNASCTACRHYSGSHTLSSGSSSTLQQSLAATARSTESGH